MPAICVTLYLMRIDFESSGGYAGITLRYHADTEELRQEVANEIRRLVEESHFFDLSQEERKETSRTPDAVAYSLSLREAGRQKILTFTDVTAPHDLKPLLALLRKLAFEQREPGNSGS